MKQFFFAFLIFVILLLFCLCVFFVTCESKMIPWLKPLSKLPLDNRYTKIDPSKVIIFMVVTPEILNYAQSSIANNEKYCQRFGYAFRVVDSNLTPDLPIHFSKLQATLNFLKQGYDYVVHLDADAIIVNSYYPITHLIAYYMYNNVSSFIAGEDCYDKTICSKPGRINSGVYIVKNDAPGKAIIQKWLSAARGSCKKYVNQFPNCQLVFYHCVRYSYLSMFILLVPYNVLNGKDGLFIQHFMQHTNQERSDAFKQHLETDLDYQNGNQRVHVF